MRLLKALLLLAALFALGSAYQLKPVGAAAPACAASATPVSAVAEVALLDEHIFDERLGEAKLLLQHLEDVLVPAINPGSHSV